MRRLFSMATPDWVYAIWGVMGAIVSGAQFPLFALGVSQALVVYYSDWETCKAEIKKIALLFTGGSAVTLVAHTVEHLSFGIIGERLTLRVRQMMFRGKELKFVVTTRGVKQLGRSLFCLGQGDR